LYPNTLLMPKVYAWLLAFALFIPLCSNAQVDEIKSASSKSSSETSSHNSSNSSGFFVDFFFNFMFSGMVQWQQQSLQKKYEIPKTVSFDIMLQGAAQPSTYYILNPRLRANWGIFSTDFRLNYLLEEDIDGVKYLRTDDWQVLQLNLVNTKNVTFRVGGGVIHESFGDGKTFPEYTGGLVIQPETKKLGGSIEYRASEPRNEISANIQYHLFDRGVLHGYATGGAVFQRYYRTVNVWGMQGGIILRFYRQLNEPND
jgi:hypothetical protein